LNGKPEQTNFCRELPVEAQSDSLSPAVSSTVSVAASVMTSCKKKKHSKVSRKELMMDLVTKIRETQRDKYIIEYCIWFVHNLCNKIHEETYFQHAPCSSKVCQKQCNER